MAFLRQRWAFGALVFSLFILGLPAACGLPDYRFTDQAGAGSGPLPSRPSCASDAECAQYPATRVCDARVALCVECLPRAAGQTSACGAGLYCAADSRCSVGCQVDGDCGDGLSCDISTHRCSGCQSNADCAAGTECEGTFCVPSCATDATCPVGFQCCAGECANALTDPLHCGGCGSACSDEQDCVNASCSGDEACQPATADCDGKRSNGCETRLANDAKNCGSCGSPCAAGTYCSGGRCTSLNCPTGLANCDNDAATQCETDLGSTASCGLCSRRCGDANGDARCDDAACSITCEAGYANCDANNQTGCESDLQTEAGHCGACEVRCENDNGSTGCSDGICIPTCATGYQDCDARPNNGCEADILESLENCGGCRRKCALDHASETCDTGVCEIVECEAGFEDCDGDPTSGCEADLTSPATCGSCETHCSSNGGKASCTGGRCSIECNPERADCRNGVVDGCETNLAISTSHCGSCGALCTTTGPGSAACYGGECGTSNCSAPFADCSSAEGSTCQTNTSTSAEHCGGCGNECYYPHGVGDCDGGQCELASCEPNWESCDDSATNGCETPLGTTSNCTRCAETCTNAHGRTSCTAQGCVAICAVGWGDCDGDPNNGCETSLNSAEDCGACNASCSRQNATSSCSSGTCTITSCAPGWQSCDDEPLAKTGCETNVRSIENCGGCGSVCSLPNANESCATGSCELTSCLAGFDDCDGGAPGCETALGTERDCSVCEDICQTQNVHVTSNVCVAAARGSECSPSCTSGWKSCDNLPSNGCETDLASPNNCGDCGIACNLQHVAQHDCIAGSCQVASCDPGWAHCNSNQADGCEVSVSGNVNNCGSCNNVCSSNHGSAACSNGTCSITCSAGFGNCDNMISNGCEHDTSSDPLNCGACGAECVGDQPFCVNRGCVDSLPISVVSSATVSAIGGADLILDYALKTAPDNYRLLLVGVAGRGNGSASRPQEVTYNGEALTLARESTVGQVYAGIYYRREADLPEAGSYQLKVTAASTQNTFGLVANVLELRGVALTSSIQATASSTAGSCSGSVVTPLNLVTPNAYLYGILALDGAALPASLASSMQTVTLQTTSGGNPGAAAGYYGPVAATGTRNFSWADPTPCSWTQSAVALRPAVAP